MIGQSVTLRDKSPPQIAQAPAAVCQLVSLPLPPPSLLLSKGLKLELLEQIRETWNHKQVEDTWCLQQVKEFGNAHEHDLTIRQLEDKQEDSSEQTPLQQVIAEVTEVPEITRAPLRGS